MRLHWLVFLAGAMVPATAFADGPSTPPVLPPWQSSGDADLQFYSWSNAYAPVGPRVPAHGSQVYAPLSVEASGPLDAFWGLEIGARSGVAYSQQAGPGFSGSVATTLDSALSTTLVYRGPSVVQPYFGLNLNLPTGDSLLTGNSVFARADPDLAGVGTFGEGFNVGPTVGANIALAPELVLGVAFGYTHHGPFSSAGAGFTSTSVVSTVDPGDEISPVLSLGYQSPRLSLQGSAAYVVDSDGRLNGLEAYRLGPREILSGTAQYDFTDLWTAALSASWTHIEPMQVLPGAPPTLLSGAGSSDDVVQAALDPRYRIGSWSVGPTASFLWRRADSWDPTTGAVIPAKTRETFGGAAEFEIAQNVSLRARVEAMWLRETPEPTLLEPPLSGTGWDAMLGADVKF